jgi:hypothetical protein
MLRDASRSLPKTYVPVMFSIPRRKTMSSRRGVGTWIATFARVLGKSLKDNESGPEKMAMDDRGWVMDGQRWVKSGHARVAGGLWRRLGRLRPRTRPHFGA